MTSKGFSAYRIDCEDEEHYLGRLEAEIMRYLWDKTSISVREVYEHLSQTRKIAYTTVMTVMNRLWEKGILKRRQKGNAFLYSPHESKESFLERLHQKVISSLSREMTPASAAFFLDSLKQDNPEILAELEKMISERKNKRNV